MRIAYLVLDAAATDDDATRTVLAQADALAADHDVRLLTLRPLDDAAAVGIDPAVAVQPLVEEEPSPRLGSATVTGPSARPSALVPEDRRLDGATDVALEAALADLDADAVVTADPSLLVAAVELLPDHVVVVHQDHRPAGIRTTELLRRHLPRVDVLVVPDEDRRAWWAEQLGALAPHLEVLPASLPGGFAPRSTLEAPVVMAAGRLLPEKQLPMLVAAFASVAEQLPDWRLRIWGTGPDRNDVVRQVRKHELWDRVELPGPLADPRSEWARASIAAVTSRVEGYPLSIPEAMAAGVPVVAFDSGPGPRALVDHEGNGLLVAPQSVAGLAAALLRLATDVALRGRLGTGARHSARAHSATALAERWVAVLGDARARRAGRGRLAARAEARVRLPAADRPNVDVSDVTPAQARHQALAAAADAARATGAPWLVVPPHEHPSPVVVLPMRARDAFLAALAAAELPAYLSLRDPADHHRGERSGPVAAMAEALRRARTSVLHLEPWAEGPDSARRPSHLATGCSVEVQLWEAAPDGSLVAPRRNPYAERLDADAWADLVDTEVEGVSVPTLPLMAEPTVTECRFPVDVVYTWVDGSDPVWDAARRERLAALTGTAQTRESSGRARFLDRGELRYSLRSIELFAPWVRRIHLVTAGQVPPWLDVDHPRINLVDHRDILPAGALPTFNSHAIETALHRIDGLAEHFVYFNDDFLLARPVRPEAFFTPAGQLAVFPSASAIGVTGRAEAAPYAKAAWNNRDLLHQRFGALVTHHLAHAPYPHRVSVLRELEAAFPEALEATAHAPFRSDTDVSTLSSLAQHFALLTGAAYVGAADLSFVNLSNADVEQQLEQVLDRQQDFICLGDHHDHALRGERLEELLSDFYPRYFPVAAPWERGG